MSAHAARNAFIIIDMRHIIGYFYCAHRAISFANAAADAARLAILLNGFTALAVVALHPVNGIIGHNFNQLLRAGFNAFAASNTQIGFNHSLAVYNSDCFTVAHIGAAAVAHAAISARHIAAPKRKLNRSARACAVIIKGFGALILCAGAAHKRRFTNKFARINPHNFCDCLRAAFAGGGAGVYGSFALSYCLCKCVAPRIAAGAAVVAGKAFANGNLFSSTST